MSEGPPAEGYTLVVCEKPDAARRVSEALAEGGLSTTLAGGVSSFSFRRKGERFVVCAAQGHMYDVSDPFAERSVYPVFDVEWFSHDQLWKEAYGVMEWNEYLGRVIKNLETGQWAVEVAKLMLRSSRNTPKAVSSS